MTKLSLGVTYVTAESGAEDAEVGRPPHAFFRKREHVWRSRGSQVSGHAGRCDLKAGAGPTRYSCWLIGLGYGGNSACFFSTTPLFLGWSYSIVLALMITHTLVTLKSLYPAPTCFLNFRFLSTWGPPPPTSRPSAWSYCYFPIALDLLYFGSPLIKLQSTQSFRPQELPSFLLSLTLLLPPYAGNDQGLSIWSPSGC